MSNNEEGILEESDLLLEIVRSIVNHPEKVVVESTQGKETTLLTLKVDPEDYGQVIGKYHKTLDAIQHLFSKAAFLDGRRTIIQLNNQATSQRPKVEPSSLRENNLRMGSSYRSPQFR